MRKKLFITTAILTLAMAISGCKGDAKEGETAGANAIEIVTTAQENMQQLSSYGFTMDMQSNVSMKDMGEMNMSMKSDASVILNPEILMKMDSDITIDIPNMDATTSQLTQYIEGTPEKITLYQQMGDQWGKTYVSDPAAIESTTQQLATNYSEFIDNAEIVGEENIGEVPCHKINVTLSGEGISKLLGNMDSMGSMGIDPDELKESEDLMKKSGDIPVELWIGKEDSKIYRQKLDVSELMKEAINKAMAEEGGEEQPTIEKSTMVLTLDFHSFDEISEIKIPEEAKNAPEINL